MVAALYFQINNCDFVQAPLATFEYSTSNLKHFWVLICLLWQRNPRFLRYYERRTITSSPRLCPSVLSSPNPPFSSSPPPLHHTGSQAFLKTSDGSVERETGGGRPVGMCEGVRMFLSFSRWLSGCYRPHRAPSWGNPAHVTRAHTHAACFDTWAGGCQQSAAQGRHKGTIKNSTKHGFPECLSMRGWKNGHQGFGVVQKRSDSLVERFFRRSFNRLPACFLFVAGRATCKSGKSLAGDLHRWVRVNQSQSDTYT